MKKKHPTGLRIKLILLTVLCTAPVGLTGLLLLCRCSRQTTQKDILASAAILLLVMVFAAIVVSALLIRRIARPAERILDKINRIALNDYTPTPELEKISGETGLAGVLLNQIGLEVQELVTGTISLQNKCAEMEAAFLQSQVNPHFLYNTLNSVLWMAIVQKNTGIESLIRSLVNLLKNVSKGPSAHILLSEELALLKDYVNIQSIRYTDYFDYLCTVPETLMDYRIIKFTLQPLVENAIFHGIIPKETFGTITVDASEEEGSLLITVTDDGAGMTPEELEAVLAGKPSLSDTAMGGIGMGNVHRRLQLAYGPQYGLRLESKKGSYTKVTVRIPKEH